MTQTYQTTGKQPVVVLRDEEPVSPVLANGDAAFSWLLAHQPFSTDHAIKHEGYSVRALRIEPWSAEEAAGLRRTALRILGAHGHSFAYENAEDRELTEENCAACALEGKRAVTPSESATGAAMPNYANWERTLIQGGRPIPRRFARSFAEALNDGTPYADCLLRDLATWGVRFTD